uniref:Reverse transcriptase Ty1/copia-type domain-containing protein n=1 Tax=Lactuca sativa TaxID=4236 RepID=A0A9R1WPM1_LACSA|nr:hypothetical protein LSAT_V11C900465440 [Lactuca sativa]
MVTHYEPKSFKHAAKDERWRLAMKKEISALEANDTWVLVVLPPGKRAIESKWVFKIKFKPNGEVERYKARLVAKGYTQMEGVDYHDTFAPVAKLVTVRILLTMAVKNNWIIHQLDVNNTFLHGDLEEEVYMKIPQGFGKEGDTRVCKLKKSLYGLKQASRNCLNDRFSIKDLGSLTYFLGIEVSRIEEGLVLSQRKYTLDVLDDADPRQSHWNAALRVLLYQKGNLGQVILLPKEGTPELLAYSDSDWLGSSVEAEYRAMATTVSDVLWVRWLLSELGVQITLHTPLMCDNESAHHIAHNPVFHEHTKHVEMDCFFVNERVESKEITPVCVSSQAQLADLLTKPLGSDRLQTLLVKLNIRNLHVST